jgi:hypothetical protein
MYIGGVLGYAAGVTGYPVNVENCRYEDGGITASLNTNPVTADFYIGGFAGYLGGAGITNCGSSSPMTMTGKTYGTVRAGGFVGQLERNPALGSSDFKELENCWAAGDINIGDAGGALAAGGLAGESRTSHQDNPAVITRCYAAGDVTAVSSGIGENNSGISFAAGGLVGQALSTTISECWAGGEVYARRDSGYMIDAGGLVGALGDYTYQTDSDADPQLFLNSSIDNCYALGNVLADKTTGDVSTIGMGFDRAYSVHAGGLAGYVRITYNSTQKNKISRSFAAGSVTAQSRATSQYPFQHDIFAGGIVGHISRYGKDNTAAGGDLSYNAALGAGVTVKGGRARIAVRIYTAISPSLQGGSSSNNYALDTMEIGSDKNYDVIFITTTTSNSTEADSVNGMSVSGSVFRNRSFWTSASYLGFDSDVWDLSTVARRGYPALKNVGGQ